MNMLKNYETVALEYAEPGVLVVTLNRPHRLNALSLAMMDDLLDLWASLWEDHETRVVILKGAGEKGFCGGVDIKEIFPDEMLNAPSLYHWQTRLGELEYLMRKIPQPIICLVHGAATGAGLSFALASDIRIITPDARFSAYYVNVGLGGADMGSSYFLPRLIGAGRAYDMLLTGRFMLADEAMQLGLASHCVERDQLLDKGLEMARMITEKDPLAIRLTKEAINQNLDSSSMERVLTVENRNQSLMFMHNLSQGKYFIGK
jgi:enoyl-CoA hydratase/carnithine racemase